MNCKWVLSFLRASCHSGYETIGCKNLSPQLSATGRTRNQFAHLKFHYGATKRIKGQQVATIELREQWIIVVVAAAIHSTHSAGRPHADLTGTVYRSSGTYYIQCTKTLDISTKPTPNGRPKQKNKKRKSAAELKKRLNRVNNYSVEILNSNNRHCSLLCALCAVRCGALAVGISFTLAHNCRR